MNDTHVAPPSIPGVPGSVVDIHAVFAGTAGVILVIIIIALLLKNRFADRPWRRVNSPGLTYPVTIHGVGGAVLINSVQVSLRQPIRRSDIHTGRSENEAQRKLVDKELTGLPSYEECICTLPVCSPEIGNNDLPPPPPYSEK